MNKGDKVQVKVRKAKHVKNILLVGIIEYVNTTDKWAVVRLKNYCESFGFGEISEAK